MSGDLLFASPAQLAELKEKLGSRRVRSMHAEMLTDEVTGQPVFGMTCSCVDGSCFTMVLDHGPVVDQLRVVHEPDDGAG